MDSWWHSAAPQVRWVRHPALNTHRSDHVVFVIVGKLSNSLIPLAETIGFRFHKNELAVRVDDEKHEAKFAIKEMMVRSEWDRLQQHIDEKMKASEDHGAAR